MGPNYKEIRGGLRHSPVLGYTVGLFYLFIYSSCPVWLLHNELPLPPLLAVNPGNLPSADPRSHSLTRTVLHLWEKTTRNTIQPIGSLLQPEMNTLAINPCCRVDKLIACIAISSPASNIKEPSVRVILQQIGIVSKYKASRTVNLDKKMRKIYFEWLQDLLSASVY